MMHRSSRYSRSRYVLGLLSLLLVSCSHTLMDNHSAIALVERMVNDHQFDRSELEMLFEQAEIKQDVLKKIAKPSEALPWYKYREIFLNQERIDAGVRFWRGNSAALAAAERQYGIPPEIIVAILGVETAYGKKTGNYRVLDSLATLAFAYPTRSQFFQGELESFLLMCRDEQFDPSQLLGSYAGAMGMPQFMPSSFRKYAVDFNHDQHRDIWHDNADAIASVANYFAQHHWQPGQLVVLPVTFKDDRYRTRLNNKDLKPDLRVAELESLNLVISRQLPLDSKVKLLGFELRQGEELWAALDNFYVITRYNHSPLYAMAVYQLSLSILNKKGSFP